MTHHDGNHASAQVNTAGTGAADTASAEEVAKVHELLEDMDIAMLTTHATDGTGRLVSRPLSTQVAEEDGDVLFLVKSTSDVVEEVRANPQVNVAYAKSTAWVSLAGTAEIIKDRDLVAQLWSSGADHFMEGGPENPENVVLKVDGDSATYWGGESLVGTVVKTIKAMRNKDKDGSEERNEDGGATTVQLP
ncbi:MAG: pyridoxamine 5'-phosphate oxidase family protein [Micrococcus sp.]|nr:pyridoxamine 5'-phosphate oxidase family protein [Micrococcus sp.]